MKDDTISRAAAIDAMMKLQTEDIEAYGASIPEGFDGDRAVAAIKALPSATDINVGGNLINRRAALDALGEEPPVWCDGEDEIAERDQWRRDVAAIKALPSAQLAQDLPKGCTDTISRSAAVEAMRKAKDKSEAHRMLVQLPSAQPGWIPTSQKPPEPFKLVLIQDSCGGYDLSMYIPSRIKPKQYPNGYWGDVDCVDYDYLDVYAWYPLPKEYRPEGEEQ